MTTDTAMRTRPDGILSLTLWVLQILLATAFAAASATKLLTTPEAVAGASGWEGSLLLIRFIGIAEALGAIGLIAPSATRIRPHLTPLAALGLTAIMLLAAGVHLGRDEYDRIAAPVGLAVLLLVVWWGRGRSLPIAPRAEKAKRQRRGEGRCAGT